MIAGAGLPINAAANTRLQPLISKHPDTGSIGPGTPHPTNQPRYLARTADDQLLHEQKSISGTLSDHRVVVDLSGNSANSSHG